MPSNAFRAIGNAPVAFMIGPLYHGTNWCDIADTVLIAAAIAAVESSSEYKGVYTVLTGFGQVFITEGYVRLTIGVRTNESGERLKRP